MKILRQLLPLQYDRLTIFCFLWAVASLFHIISFPQSSLSNPFALVTGLIALTLLIRPNSLPLFITLLCFSIAKTVYWMPYPPNHILFELILNIGILTALCIKIFNHFSIVGHKKSMQTEREKLFDSFAPFVRIALLSLYFFAVLHKLNADYLNPLISCGAAFLEEIKLNGFRFIPDTYLVKITAVYGTLLTESSILLLLLFKRTRIAGISLGLALHFFFTLHPHSGLESFSSLLFSIFFLFTTADFPSKLKSTINKIVHGETRTVKLFSLLAIIAVFFSIYILSQIKLIDRLDFLIFASWCMWSIFLSVVFFTVTFSEKSNYDRSYTFFKISPIYQWLLLFMIFVNGFSPYLGLKTETSFAMFSNLRTEGNKTNHLFIPLSLHLTNWQEDLVDIKKTNLKAFNSYIIHDHLITSFEFNRIVRNNLNENFYVTYDRNDKPFFLKVINKKITTKDSLTEVSYVLNKIMHFRPIDKGPCLCKH